MIVGMVDDRALRLRQQASGRQPRPTPQPVEPRRTALLNRMGEGMLRNQQAQIQAGSEGLGTQTANILRNRGVVPDSVLTEVGALAGDMVFDPINAVPGLGLVVGGVGKAGRLSALINRLNKSTDVKDVITPSTKRSSSTARPNDANEGLFRPGAQSFDYKDVPDPASPYTFGLVPTEKLAPLREFDRMAEPAGQGVFGPDNVQKLIEHLAEGGKLNDPVGVGYDPLKNWGYLAEGNHRLAAAQALGLEQLPATVWRRPGSYLGLLNREMIPQGLWNTPPAQRPPGTPDIVDINNRFARGPEPQVGRRLEIDTNQLRRDPYGDFPKTVGDYYVPPTMNPSLFKYFRPE